MENLIIGEKFFHKNLTTTTTSIKDGDKVIYLGGKMEEGKEGYQPGPDEIRAAMSHLTPEDRGATEKRDQEKWIGESKPATDWIAENREVGEKVFKSFGLEEFPEFGRILSGRIYNYELPIIKESMKKFDDPEKVFQDLASHICLNYNELYPVGVWDSVGERWM
ncbi:MAG: hypothetical protein NTW79_04265 [Candidatus Berkelbacteria bacterium]|nr:hypothetical protein [Candidatus Berkelbacteria bacterium]